MTNNNIQQVEEFVKRLMSEVVAHDYKHVYRVKSWALQIARQEKYDDLVAVEISSLMHDIGLTQAAKRSQHGAVGADMAAKFLTENNLLALEKIDEICNAIRFHSTNRGGAGELLDILRDADMLDLFGAVGIMRAFTSKSANPEYDPANIKSSTWQMSASDFDQRFDDGTGIGQFIIDQINFQISCYDNLRTKTAKELAKPLVDYMRDFIIRLDAEIQNGR